MIKKNFSDKSKIIVRGARVNNLKNIDVEIPRDKLVIITGLSGSGKSSLAFDVIYAEGNRRYLEGMSGYATQFLDVSAKPDVDRIENLTPTISIDQRSIGRSSRSTVGTLTEIYDYLRILFAKIGVPHCPHCKTPLEKISNQEVLDDILDFADKSNIIILGKLNNRDGKWEESLKNISQLGYARLRINGKIMLTSDILDRKEFKDIFRAEVVVDRLILNKKAPDQERILDSIETAFKLSRGVAMVICDDDVEKIYNRDFVCKKCSFEVGDITPKHFSFNSPEGACQHCLGLGIIKEIDEDLLIPNKNLTLAEGAIFSWNRSCLKSSVFSGGTNILEVLGKQYGFSINTPIKKISREQLNIILYGSNDPKIIFEGVIPAMKKKYEEANAGYLKSEIEKYMVEKECPLCSGKRLKSEYLAVLVLGKSIDQIVDMSLDEFIAFLNELEEAKIGLTKKNIVVPLSKEMHLRAMALQNVGLEYLTLSRGANSLSGGEGQRIRLSSQIGSELSGITYVLDEPSIGLHSRDTEKLIETMNELREAGNSLLVVEHDEAIIRSADWIIDLGPGAGEYGGEIVFSGELNRMLKTKTLTAEYLNGKKQIGEKKQIRKGSGKTIEILGASERNLKNIDVIFPLGKFISVTGVSGSGKSTLVSDILSRALTKYFFKSKELPGKHRKIKGIENIDKVISVDQAPIGRTPRSNAATYTGVFTLIREAFSETEEAKARGYDAGRFSFNMKGGRCEDCQGEGQKKIEMHLLPDVYVPCETCDGTKYNQRTLDIEYRGVNISQVLDMSVSYAAVFFKNSKLILEKLIALEKVGLGYLKLGQSAINLSGGEAQRIKLATELARRSTGKTLYILDEPTIGLHFEDIRKLLNVLNALVDKGNTVLVVEHNTDVIKNSDWVIDLGPEGGSGGGEIVYCGVPQNLKKCKKSWTGKYL